jgi:hypothetical protein
MQTDHVAASTSKKAAAKPATRTKAAKSKTLSVRKTSPTPSSDELNSMIATAAYFCAERRGFEPGHELEDWLAAEQEVRTVYSS